MNRNYSNEFYRNLYSCIGLVIKDRPLIDREKRIDRFHHINDKENNGGVTGTLIAFTSAVFILYMITQIIANVADQIKKNTDCFLIYI